MTPAELAAELTARFRTPSGTWELKEVQALGLHALMTTGRLWTNASVGAGKAAPLDEPVLTPTGWRPIGALRPGDFVIGSGGTPVKVLSIHPQGVRQVAKVTFSDGSWTRCDWDHLWTVRQERGGTSAKHEKHSRVGGLQSVDYLGGEWRTYTLRDIVEGGLTRKVGGNSHGKASKNFIPMVRPVQYPEAKLPLDPYTLGALLGDGNMSQAVISFTSMDDDIVAALRLPDGVSPRPTLHQKAGRAVQYTLTRGPQGRGAGPNPLVSILQDLGLHGHKSGTKFIPEAYMHAAVDQRLALLQGLFDTDGTTAQRSGAVEFSSLSHTLARQVQELVESLGGRAKWGAEAKNGNARLHCLLPRHLPPFRCRRKGEAWASLPKRQHEPVRAMWEVEDAGEHECVCISVDAWDSLYVTRHHIVTHNTLILALAMTVAGGERPMILTEASNVTQMKRDFEVYRCHWRIPTGYRIESYEALSNDGELLSSYSPTWLGCDEAHKLKDVTKSGRSKKFDRWRRANPDVPVSILTGSPGTEFKEFAHTLVWAIPELSAANGGPIPVNEDGQPRGKEFQRLQREWKKWPARYDAFLEALYQHPGIVIWDRAYNEVPLHIKHTIIPTEPEMEEHWRRLREFGEAPDEWVLEGPAEQWALARCLSNGMYYEHNPRPPEPYRDARRSWCRQVRDTVDWRDAPGGPYDTPGEVAKGVVAGHLPDHDYRAWMSVQGTYDPVTTTTWLGRAKLDYAVAWAREREHLVEADRGGIIIWVDQIGAGERLEEMTGWPYYGDQAKDRRGRHVSAATARIIICSVNSCGTGKNLQRYSRNLYLNPPSNNDAAEQRLGRTHRPGQKMASVEVEFLYGCMEDWAAFHRAMSQAKTNEKELKAPRKLLLAHHDKARYPNIKEVGLAWQKADATVVVDVPADAKEDL